MHFQFLVEDSSGEILIRHIMRKFLQENKEISYDCKSFKGIGGFRVSSKASEVKTKKLLNDLPMYLRGFDKRLRGIRAVMIIVVDNDDREIDVFRNQLELLIKQENLTIDHVLGIAVEEMEAWLLGDKEAVFSAYPNARESAFREYKQDSICGTWEMLANVVYKGGFARFKKDCCNGRYHAIGKYKAEWADKIGSCMELDRNLSPSFCSLLAALRQKAKVV